MAAAAAVSEAHSWGGLSSLQNSNTIACWHTSSIYIWINIRKIQINEWNAGEKIILLKIKQQAGFALRPPLSAASIFLKFLPSFHGSCISSPSSFPSFFSLVWKATSLSTFISTAVPQSPCPPSSFLPHLPSPIVLSISWPAISLISLFPLSGALPPPAEHPAAHTVSLFQCRTKWRLMKGGWCVCHSDRSVQPLLPAKHQVYSERTSQGRATAD